MQVHDHNDYVAWDIAIHAVLTCMLVYSTGLDNNIAHMYAKHR